MKHLQKLKEYAQQGAKELSEHPIKYPALVIKDAIKDYWDLGLTAYGGYQLAHGGMLGSTTGLFAFILGSFAGYAQGKNLEATYRGARNVFAGISGAAFGSGGYLNEGLGVLLATVSLCGENRRRKERNERLSSSENSRNLNVSLENLAK